MSNYNTKKELNDATAVDTMKLGNKRELIASECGVDKLDINKLVCVPTGLSILKRKADNLDFHKSRAVPVDFKRLSDQVM